MMTISAQQTCSCMSRLGGLFGWTLLDLFVFWNYPETMSVTYRNGSHWSGYVLTWT